MNKRSVNPTEEPLVQQLMALTGAQDQAQLKEKLSQVFSMYEAQRAALESMGVVSLVVVPNGLFQFTVSPNLVATEKGLDAVEQALADFAERFLRPARKRVMEEDLKKRMSQAENPPEAVSF